jgi:hypothetical protein
MGWLSLDGALVVGPVLILAGAAAGAWRARRSWGRIAYEIESRAPECRNLLVTAAELAGPAPAGRTRRAGAPAVRPEIVRLVESRAARLVRSLDAARLFPLRRAFLTLLVGLAVWSVLGLAVRARELDPVPLPGPDAGAARAGDAPAIAAIEAVVTPPAYTGLEPTTIPDPQRLTVVAGGRVDLRIQSNAASIIVTTLDGTLELSPLPDGDFATDIVIVADGFLALEPRANDGEGGPRRLIGLTVVPDAPPLVRITEPGQDLFLPTAEHTIPLTFSAQDDFAVDSLRLAYTIVSGSGETFEFTEGELATRITRADARRWSATAELSLTALGLGLGDMVVYRAIATDRRPDAAAVESDAFVAEIVGDDAAIAGGFALESDEERDALSQRMIIIKTERLLAQAATMPPEDYEYESRRLAAEQRAVRAEFVFMMGGEVQDEEEEAAHEHEVASGRLELRGRREMSRAVLLMSQAAAQLGDVNPAAALPLETAALEALQSALARSRYILRVLAGRESIDLTRRLTGETGAVLGRRAGEVPGADPELDGLRRAIAGISSLAASDAFESGAGRELSRLAEDVFRLDPSVEALQLLASELDTAANLVAAGDEAAARDALAGTLATLMARIEARLPTAPQAAEADPQLAGALIDALDSGGRR